MFKLLKRFNNNGKRLNDVGNNGNNVGQGKGICKKGKNFKLMMPKELELGVPLKIDKIKSISSSLASHYGSDWKEESLSYFTNLFQKNDKQTSLEASEHEESQNVCEVEDCLEL